MSKEKKGVVGFSYAPETIVSGPDGEHQVASAAHYTLFITHSNGRLAYVAKENKYYLGEGVGPKAECPTERLNQLMRYLRWNYDEMVEEVVSEGGSLKTGYMVSKFPPTPENIEKKRRELMDELRDNGEYLDAKAMEKILAKTSPTEMVENEAFQQYLDEVPQDARLARRLAGQTGF